jgi:hypothetical protein
MLEYLLQILGVDAAVLSESKMGSLNYIGRLVLFIVLNVFSASIAGYFIN